MYKDRRCPWLICILGVLVFLVSSHMVSAETKSFDPVYSNPLRVTDVLGTDFLTAPREPETQAASEEASFAASDAVQAQFVITLVDAHMQDGVQRRTFQDLSVCGPFELAVRSNKYSIPYGEELSDLWISQTDSFGNTVDIGDIIDTSVWGWRTSFATSGTDGASLDAHMGGLGSFSRKNELNGYAPSQGSMVYFGARIPVVRNHIQYYDAQGNAIAHGAIFAFHGTDISNPPSGIDFGPADEPLRFCVRGTQQAAPSTVTGPLELQVVGPAITQYTVSFKNLGLPHGSVQRIDEGGTIDWSSVGNPPEQKGWQFVGWVTTDSDTPFDRNTPIHQDLTLHAKYIQIHTITFFVSEASLAPHAELAVTDGSTIADLDTLVSVPKVNQSFDGWFSQSGVPFTSTTVITESLNVYGSYTPLQAVADLTVYRTHGDGEANESFREPMQVGSFAVHNETNDEIARYYITPDKLVLETVQDFFFNTYTFKLGREFWFWSYAPGGTLHSFSQDEPGSTALRWYFGDAFAYDQVIGGKIYLSYYEDVVFHTVYLHDGPDQDVFRTELVLDRQPVAVIASHPQVLGSLPSADLEAFDDFKVLGGKRSDYPDSIRDAIHLYANYKPRHAVRFFLDTEQAEPLFEFSIVDGKMIPWEQIASPSLKGSRFDQWYTKAKSRAVQTIEFNAPITQPLDIYAGFIKLRTISIDLGDGNVRQFEVDDGTAVDLTGVEPARRDNLNFAHWVDAEGNIVTSGHPALDDLWLSPRYAAQVRFVDNDGVVHEQTVLEGETLPALPEGRDPSEPGFRFYGWMLDPTETPVDGHLTVEAEYAAEITYVYGLRGEHVEVIPVRVGDPLILPDATVPGYTHEWSAETDQPVTHPLSLSARYTPIPEPPKEEEGDGDQDDPLPIDEDLPFFEGGGGESVSDGSIDYHLAQQAAQHGTERSAEDLLALLGGGRYQLPDDDLPHPALPVGTVGHCLE